MLHLFIIRDTRYNTYFVLDHEELATTNVGRQLRCTEVLWEGIGFNIAEVYDARNLLVTLEFALQCLITRRKAVNRHVSLSG